MTTSSTIGNALELNTEDTTEKIWHVGNRSKYKPGGQRVLSLVFYDH